MKRSIENQKCNTKTINEAVECSEKEMTSLFFDYTDFINNQSTVEELLGEHGFVMFTEKHAILCMKKAPNLRIILRKNKYFIEDDFKDLHMQDAEIIGSARKKGWVQYLEDLKDNIIWILIITVVYFFIYHFGMVNAGEIVSLCENLLSVMGIFTSIVFAFVGFIYSDSERVIESYLKGTGDKYYETNRYIMNLSITVILCLIFVIAFGKMEKEDLPNWLIYIKSHYGFINKLVSIKVQYTICQLLTWFSVCSMIICFKSLMDYYMRDLKYTFFIAAINKKSQKWKSNK